MSRPVVLATFANDRYGPTTGYLRDLVGERRAIEQALGKAPVEVVTRSNITLDELFELFTEYEDRICVWHHGGHAESDALFLETDVGEPRAAHVAGLAARIGQLPQLRLMVLNGCCTAGQVAALHGAAQAPVIATDQAILDAAARAFAERLYRDLAADRSIEHAFTSAASRVEADGGPTRMLRPAAPPKDEPPWRLHLHPEAPESGGWRLSQAARSRQIRRWVIAGVAALATLALVALLLPQDDGPLPPVCAAETCDGLDEDCDTAIDEGHPCTAFGVGPIWGTAACVDGACEMTTCPAGWHDIDGIHGTGCEYRCDPIGDETCNAIDDDCDGLIDENFPGCDLRCDGVDDDGDGRSDEGCPITRCGPERTGHEPVPPCNGCPDGTAVPTGWVCVPQGEAKLGGPPDPASWARFEAPERTVRIERPFLMHATEVTRAQWAAIAPDAGGEPRPSYDHCAASPDDACPVDRINWFEAVWFANALSAAEGRSPCYDREALGACWGLPGSGCATDEIGCAYRFDSKVMQCTGAASAALRAAPTGCEGYRLPTRDEWEYAARAGASGRGQGHRRIELEARAWIESNATRRTHPVATRDANAWGLYDMLGNVAEPVHGDRTYHLGGDIFTLSTRVSYMATALDGPDYRLHRWGIRLVRPLPAAPAP